MPRGRYRGDDEWSNDSDYDDIRMIRKHVSRSRSRHDRRYSPEGPPVTFVENKLIVPGSRDRGHSHSRSRHRSSSDEREREHGKTERLLAELALSRRGEGRYHDDDDRYHDEELKRRFKLEQREEKLKEEERLKRWEWDQDERHRSDERRKKDILRDLEDEKKKREEDMEKAVRAAAEKKKKDEEERKKIAEEARLADEAKAKKDKAEKERIILEAQFEAEEKKKKDKELKEKILREHELEKQKEKDKKKKEEEEFEERVRERAIKAGMDPDKAVRALRDKSPSSKGHSGALVRHGGAGFRRRVRVRRDHILPQTLDSYKLSWNYDERDSSIIIIEDEIDDEFLWELQNDSERIIKSRKLITPGYKKETITTLTPGGSAESIRKKNGQYYMVRKRSVSRSRHLSDFF